MEALQVLGVVLDLLDATGTVLALMTVWYTWIAPPRAPETVITLELEPFLEAVTAATPARPGAPPNERADAQAASGQALRAAGDRA